MKEVLEYLKIFSRISYYTYPLPLHVLQRIIPAPLQAVHSIGDRLVKPSTESSRLSLFVISIGVSLLPVALQNIHASPPEVAQDGHGFGSDFKPCAIARPPNMTEVATADIAWLVSSVLIEEGSMMECVFIDNRWFWLFRVGTRIVFETTFCFVFILVSIEQDVEQASQRLVIIVFLFTFAQTTCLFFK
jgi:hypothetical protein|tara:strand:- start:884 stop:1450 length:567 start_codon:yes stop_codon:yes gene_type:complete